MGIWKMIFFIASPLLLCSYYFLNIKTNKLSFFIASMFDCLNLILIIIIILYKIDFNKKSRLVTCADSFQVWGINLWTGGKLFDVQKMNYVTSYFE